MSTWPRVAAGACWHSRGLNRILAVAAAFAVVACGGGGGGSASPEAVSQGEFSGTAAVGLPVAGGTLDLRCAVGNRSAQTGPDGRYRVELESAIQLPCVMFVRGGTVGGQPHRETMAGILLRLGGVANVTPWTHLIAARLLGGDPNNAIQAMSGPELTRALTDEKVAAARAFVREQLARVLGNSPAEDIDPVGGAFEAVAGNGMDDLVSAITRGLEVGGKSLTLAAQEIALHGLEMVFTPRGCRAGVLTGFTGRFDDVPVQTAYRPPPNGGLGGTESFGGTAGDDSGGGGEGSGVGGSLGQFLRAKVEVRRADGSLLGTATTDADKGMVTLVRCDYRGPLRITIRGERDDATYYDESRKLNLSFAGRSMCAVLPGATRNIGVTPLTNAACAYLDELVKNRPPVTGRASWADEVLIERANAAALKAYNDHAGASFQLDDITRLPVVIGAALDQQQGFLPFDQNGIYAAVLAGLVQSAGRYDPDTPSPALAFTDQIARDLTDGTLDHATAGGQSAFAGATPTYLVDQMPGQAFSNVAGSAQRLGDAALRGAGAQVVKHVFIPAYHQELLATFVVYDATVELFGDGRIVTVVWPRGNEPAAVRIESPAAVRFVDFRIVEKVVRGSVPNPTSPTTFIGFTGDGSIYTLAAPQRTWLAGAAAQAKVVDVVGAPSRFAQQLVTLTSDGRVRGDDIESKLPVGQRYEGLAELSVNAMLLVDADRRVHSFFADANRFVSSGLRGRYAPLTPFVGVRTKMVAGSGTLEINMSTLQPVATGNLLVLDLSGRVWFGPVSVDPAAPAATRLANAENICYVHWWYALRCDGTLVDLHRPALPVALDLTRYFPATNRLWRIFREIQPDATADFVRALSREGCIYSIRFLADGGTGPSGQRWVVAPVFEGAAPPSACVSAEWLRSPGPITFDL